MIQWHGKEQLDLVDFFLGSTNFGLLCHLDEFYLYTYVPSILKKKFDQKISATYIKVCCPNWSWNVTKSKLKKTFL